MAKDTRVFKVTRTNGRVQYCTRNAVSGMFATGKYGVARAHGVQGRGYERRGYRGLDRRDDRIQVPGRQCRRLHEMLVKLQLSFAC